MTAGWHIRRWPLFVPLLPAIAGLALTRTDMLGISMSGVILAIGMVVLLLFKMRLPALLLLLGAFWGTAGLFLDAGRMYVASDWLAGDMEISADVEKAETFPRYDRYLLNHIRRQDGVALSGKALLYQHRGGATRLQAGQRIHVRVRWHEPHNYHNPGAFDYRAWCFDHHIALIGSMKGMPEIIDASVPWLEQQRQSVRRIIAATGVHDSGILQAVLLAERSQLTAQAYNVFSATGAAHLLAISGMHIAMAASFAFGLVWFVLTRREAWIVRFPVRGISLFSGCLAAFAYGSMAGWPLPAIRAAIMLAAAVLAWCLSSRSEPMNTLLAALALILLFDPAAIASLSLWLSFVATSALLLWAVKSNPDETGAWISRFVGAGKLLIWVSLLATLATLPLIVSTFGRVPVYSLPANLVMVPLYALIVIPVGLLAELLAVTGLDSLAIALMQFAGSAAGWGLNWLDLLSRLPAGQLWAIHPPVWLSLLYMAGMLLSGWWLLRKKRMVAMLSAVTVLIAWLGYVLVESDVRTPQWVVWDVGQGAASTLLLPGKRVIALDAPGREGSRFNGGTTVAAGLRHLGLTHIDVLILSHAQSDHLGGALSLLNSVNSVGQIWLPDVPDARRDRRVQSIEACAAEHGIAVRWLAKGDHIEIGNRFRSGQVRFSVLWPPRSFDPANANNTSLVLAASLENGTRLLWPGDIESEAERSLVNAGLETADYMLMPHHGSNTSSRMEFLKAVQPKAAIVQTGFANRYGFPARSVLRRYRDIGADVYNTADGAVLLRSLNTNNTVEISQWQRDGQRMRRELVLQWWKS